MPVDILKNLTGIIDLNRKITDDFIQQFWNFYHCLLDYKLEPSNEYAKLLESKFQLLFETKTGYGDLDERIASTLCKQNLRDGTKARDAYLTVIQTAKKLGINLYH